MSRIVKAIEIEVGARVSAIHWADSPVEQIARRFGRYPKVTRAHYREVGEAGQPTVYVYIADGDPGVYCLRPAETLTVEG